MKNLIAVTMLVIGGCSKKTVTAQEACAKLEAAGEVTGCRDDKPGGLAKAAIGGAGADLPTVPGKGCGVWQFQRVEDVDQADKAFTAMGMLAGPHRYANRSAMIFVQCNADLSADRGAAIKKIVDGL